MQERKQSCNHHQKCIKNNSTAPHICTTTIVFFTLEENLSKIKFIKLLELDFDNFSH